MDLLKTEGVSVIVLCHKRTNYVINAVESIKEDAKQLPGIEIIVTKAFNNEKIELKLAALGCIIIHNESDHLGSKFADALRACKHEIVFLLEDDDVFIKGKIDEHLKLYSRIEGLKYVVNGYTTIDSLGNPVNSRIRLRSRRIRRRYPDSIFVSDTLTNKHLSFLTRGLDMGFNTSRISFTRSSFLPYLPFLQEIEFNLDTALFLIGTFIKIKMCDITMALTGYRIHSGNVSTRSTQVNPTQFISERVRYAAATLHFYKSFRETFLSNLPNNNQFRCFCLCMEYTSALFISALGKTQKRVLQYLFMNQLIYTVKCSSLRLSYRSIFASFFLLLLGMASPRLVNKLTLVLGAVPNFV
ncbi:MAG: glycosyltransferase [Thermoplasmatales archaeon]